VEVNKIYLGDCLIESDRIESGSVDLILTDLPYGTVKGLGTSRVAQIKNYNMHQWDETLPLDKIMQIANRILRKNGKMILTANQPFTTQLINAQIPNLPYCYNMYWDKMHFANCMVANTAPVSYIEDILIFSKNHQKHDFENMHPLRPYFKNVMDFIGLSKKIIIDKIGQRADHTFRTDSTQYRLCTEQTHNELIQVFGIDKMQGFKEFTELKQIDTEYRTELLRQMNEQYPSTFNLWEGKKYKSNILKYKKDYDGYHPTQKPVLLLEDLIKTFSNENDLVVDLTSGSGSTAVACINTKRNYICIEKEQQYFDLSVERVRKHQQQVRLDV